MELTLKITDAAELSKFGAFLSGFGQTESSDNAAAIGFKPTQNTPVAKPEKVVATPAQRTTRAVAEESKAEAVPAPEVAKSSGPTLEQLRATAATKTKEDNGAKRDAVKALLSEYGASSVSALGTEHYVDFLAKVEAL